jgi:hypothetical protein
MALLRREDEFEMGLSPMVLGWIFIPLKEHFFC